MRPTQKVFMKEKRICEGISETKMEINIDGILTTTNSLTHKITIIIITITILKHEKDDKDYDYQMLHLFSGAI